MNQTYYGATHSPLARRATVPISPSLAQSVSMIDPNLQNPNYRVASSSATHIHAGGPSLQTYPLLGMANHQSLQPQSPSSVQRLRQPTQPLKKMVDTQKDSSPESEQTTTDRSLPTRDVNEESIDAAYAQFILYCNPTIPIDTETEELKKGFRNPPRSDGNSFSPWTLFILLQRLEKKEIKTWAHLVIELGVEPPDREKNQSAQKVQQYAVRLKVSRRPHVDVVVYDHGPLCLSISLTQIAQRWLRAYHIDSFFSYLSSRPNAYYTDLPMTDTELAETVREGVPPEEDLAVRALLPEWRPKRGRRKADDAAEGETPVDSANPSNPRNIARMGSADFNMFEDQYSATPSSALTWTATPSHSQGDVWSAAQAAIVPKTPSPGMQNQALSANPNSAVQRVWRSAQAGPNSAETPTSDYLQSAISVQTPMSAPGVTGENEPKSAAPSSATAGSRSPGTTKRKRHAPAISSAWNQGSFGGKIRGRPPSNRNIQDGPFGTFPVNPSPKDAGTVQNVTSSGISTVPATHQKSASPPAFMVTSAATPGHTTYTSAGPKPSRSRSNSAAENNPSALRKPSKLQLQVPQHQGGPIHLATPPRVLVNGETQLQQATEQEGRPSGDLLAQLSIVAESEDIPLFEGGEGVHDVDWKRQCFMLMRRLQEKEAELKKVKRAVLDAVM